MFCCVDLCRVVSYRVVLCRVVLCCVVLCRVMPYCVMQQIIMFYCIVLSRCTYMFIVLLFVFLSMDGSTDVLLFCYFLYSTPYRTLLLLCAPGVSMVNDSRQN